jgi:hypothetical protein
MAVGFGRFMFLAPTSVSASTTLDPIGANAVLANATGGAFTVTLPSLKDVKDGEIFYVQKVDSSANAVTVAAASGENIEGGTSVSLSTQWTKVMVFKGTDNKWHRIN